MLRNVSWLAAKRCLFNDAAEASQHTSNPGVWLVFYPNSEVLRFWYEERWRASSWIQRPKPSIGIDA